MTPSPSDPMAPSQDDEPIELWLSRLAQSPGAGPGAAGSTLRRRLAAERAAVQHAGLDNTQAEERALHGLRFRLRREGIDFGAAARRRWWAAGMAAALVVTITVPLLHEPAETDTAEGWPTVAGAPPAMRGPSSPIEWTTAEPRSAARGLASTLSKLGIEPVIYEEPDRTTLVFTLQPEQVPVVEQSALAPRRLAGTRPGENRIVILPPAR